METKNLLILLISNFILISGCLFGSEKKINIETSEQIGKYWDFQNKTPSEFNALRIKSYLNKSSNDFEYRTIENNKSKTNIFNHALSGYVKDVYNNQNYANFISQNGSHIVDFLELSEELNLEITPLYTCLRLFYNKIKSCELVDDTVLIQILKPLPNLIHRHFEKNKEKLSLQILKRNIEKTITFRFTNHIKEFEEKPNSFISKLSEEVIKVAKEEVNHLQQNKNKNYMKERFRNLIIRFLEITISKLIWDTQSYHSIWQSVLEISDSIMALADYKALDHIDDLDDLLWSLTHRFNYFLKITGPLLPPSFYEEVEDDIANGAAYFLEMEELDEGITTKKEILLRTLIQAKTKSIAFQDGLFSNQLL